MIMYIIYIIWIIKKISLKKKKKNYDKYKTGDEETGENDGKMELFLFCISILTPFKDKLINCLLYTSPSPRD